MHIDQDQFSMLATHLAQQSTHALLIIVTIMLVCFDYSDINPTHVAQTFPHMAY